MNIQDRLNTIRGEIPKKVVIQKTTLDPVDVFNPSTSSYDRFISELDYNSRRDLEPHSCSSSALDEYAICPTNFYQTLKE